MNRAGCLHDALSASLLVSAVVVCAACAPVAGQPVQSAWPIATGPSPVPTATAAAALSGYVAVADSAADTIEIRGVDQALMHTVSKAQIQAACPWMNLDASQDGPSAMAFSDSGRLLFFAVHDASPPGDGLGSDCVLRFDTQTGELTTFTRLEISATDAIAKPPGLAFYKGRVYLGFTGSIIGYRALANDKTNAAIVLVSSPASASGHVIEGIAIDRLTNTMYASWNNQVFRSTIGASSLTFASVGALAARSLAWSDHYGGAANSGLYALESTAAPAFNRVWRLSPAQARGTAAFAPTAYLVGASLWRGLSATADGGLLTSAAGAGVSIRDASDTRLAYAAFLQDEFAQHVAFARGLISPDGEPAGWVIDADVIPAWNRFHPATPDGACWTILTLMMHDYLNGDTEALPQVRQILQRYAGRAPDGIGPSRTADGIFRHWINPLNGGVKPGWDPEFATLSTMKIVLAAARARAFYPSDPEIAASAHAIICGVANWDTYINPVSNHYYYTGQSGGGPNVSPSAAPINEGIIFVNQCATYGGFPSQVVLGNWLNRGLWPTATYVTGRGVTGDSANNFQPAFINIYPMLTLPAWRASTAWQTQMLNVRLSHMAWTDDNAPVWNTVFSAGTTKGEWGGYRADAINNSTGNISTFTALLGLAGGTGAPGSAFSPAAGGAYQAYRVGARETFKGGAAILYRRSSVDPAYLPDSAGLPDVSMGALGLAELLSPGSLAAVLNTPYATCTVTPPCVLDYNADGSLNPDDLGDFITEYYTVPALPGPGGFASPCKDAAPPYNAGYRTGFTLDGSRWCQEPNPDNLGDYITAYFQGC
ncbi:MAG: hypothetical protein ACKVS8_14315 [Phycisphaerales bacterium]